MILTQLIHIETVRPYDAVMRRLIHRAKISGDRHAYEQCLSAVTQSAEAAKWADWADVMMPVPASLWGRIRGRFDIATGATHDLSKLSGRPWRRAPWELHWRLRKHALVEREMRGVGVDKRERRPAVTDKGERIPEKILLIDDVITTGESVTRVCQALPRDCRVVALILADARQESSIGDD